MNRYKPHVYVLPEDDANRQIANGFFLHPGFKERVFQVLPCAGGWSKVKSAFLEVHVFEMQRWPERRIVLLIDCDRDEARLNSVRDDIPQGLKDRVFVIGVLTEPEDLKRRTGKSFEDIGRALATDCVDETREVWGHELLRHNEVELRRLISLVKPILAESKTTDC